ncbi:unnamed protein product [Polarella glacialis]|uniref:RING-type domain-containing protein n=1 Tax=Polarella glacialis TaxID=89957 RepID=A0A813K0P6_POLGL|nr:unnamed protein product [Polarella glacialis]
MRTVHLCRLGEMLQRAIETGLRWLTTSGHSHWCFVSLVATICEASLASCHLANWNAHGMAATSYPEVFVALLFWCLIRFCLCALVCFTILPQSEDWRQHGIDFTWAVLLSTSTVSLSGVFVVMWQEISGADVISLLMLLSGLVELLLSFLAGSCFMYSKQQLEYRVPLPHVTEIKRTAAPKVMSAKYKTFSIRLSQKQGAGQHFTFNQDSCTICLETFAHGDVAALLCCSHVFHKSCIEIWLHSRRDRRLLVCPLRCLQNQVLGGLGGVVV